MDTREDMVLGDGCSGTRSASPSNACRRTINNCTRSAHPLVCSKGYRRKPRTLQRCCAMCAETVMWCV
jgi:hypothetical protein